MKTIPVELKTREGMLVSIPAFTGGTRELAQHIVTEAKKRRSSYYCFGSGHTLSVLYTDSEFGRALSASAGVAADGISAAWLFSTVAGRCVRRQPGPDVTNMLCSTGFAGDVTVGFFGSTNEVLERIRDELASREGAPEIVYMESPEYAPVRTLARDQYIADINRESPDILFVGLGCPKQERWMHRVAGRVNSVLLGVGAAFDFLAGVKPRAPSIVRLVGLEWLYRSVTEPRRIAFERLPKQIAGSSMLAIETLLHGVGR